MSAPVSETVAPVRIAVMSFAHTHAATYVEILKKLPGVELLTSDPGQHSPHELRGIEAAQSLEVPYVDTYEELLAWRPHGVIIASENANHRADVEAAAAAGASILCEKPLATTLEDGLAIKEAVSRAGVNLMIAFPVRFATNFNKLKLDHAAGLLGDIIAIRGSNNGKLPTEREWFTDPLLSGGGALVDHVVHIADLIDGLTAANATSVTAIVNRKLHSERANAETAGLVTISYDDGSVAAIDCSWSQPDTAATWGGVRVVVTGTEGATDIDFFGPRARGLDSSTGLPIEIPYGPNFNAALLETFIDAVRTGTPAQPDVEVGLKTLRIVLAAQESASTGRTVSIP